MIRPVGGSFATDPSVVSEQAGMVAAAWSPHDAPQSWLLTAKQFASLRDDQEMLAVAATIPPERLPPLLFTAAATYLVLAHEPDPLRSLFPRAGERQPALGPQFESLYREFCLDHRNQLLELCARHRYQMNEVGRCADLVPALAPAISDGRELVDRAGAERDLDWISIDPLVPMGAKASRSVLGVRVPPALIERTRREGVIGVIGRLAYRQGARSDALLGLAHPAAAWLEWLAPAS